MRVSTGRGGIDPLPGSETAAWDPEAAGLCVTSCSPAQQVGDTPRTQLTPPFTRESAALAPRVSPLGHEGHSLQVFLPAQGDSGISTEALRGHHGRVFC